MGFLASIATWLKRSGRRLTAIESERASERSFYSSSDVNNIEPKPEAVSPVTLSATFYCVYCNHHHLVACAAQRKHPLLTRTLTSTDPCSCCFPLLVSASPCRTIHPDLHLFLLDCLLERDLQNTRHHVDRRPPSRLESQTSLSHSFKCIFLLFVLYYLFLFLLLFFGPPQHSQGWFKRQETAPLLLAPPRPTGSSSRRLQ